MLVYKILGEADWNALEAQGISAGAAVDRADGFVHLSTAEQAAETAEKHFSGRTDLVLIALDADSLGQALRWEPARGGALFPHLYGPLRAADVVWAGPLPLGPEGRHRFPAGLGA